MNFLNLLLQAGQVVENAAEAVLDSPAGQTVAESANQAAQAPVQGKWMTWVMLGGIVLIMYFLMIRPQRKAQKEQQAFLSALTNGSRVITAGGIYGKVVEVGESTLLIEVDNGVKIRVSKASVQRDPADMKPKADKAEK